MYPGTSGVIVRNQGGAEGPLDGRQYCRPGEAVRLVLDSSL